jgi:hypothetical protein
VGFFDFSILNYIHDNFQCGFLDTLMPVVSELGNAGLIWIVIAGAFLIGRKNGWPELPCCARSCWICSSAISF